MNFSDINNEHKVQLNLSSSTWQIIENDLSLFYEKELPNLSGPLNTIFQNYYDMSNLNITKSLTEKINNLRKTLAYGNISKDSEEKICNHYLNSQLDALRAKYSSTPKGIGRKIRISDQNYYILASFPDTSYECQIFAPSPGKFLSALFEDYSQLPLYKREAIAYTNEINTIQYAIDTHVKVKIDIGNDITSLKSYEIKPYIIMPDSTMRYNYIAGYSRIWGSETEFKVASFRISKAKNLKRTQSKFAFSKTEVNEIKKAIQEKGVPFLVGDLISYEVEFTPSGLYKFRSIMNLRPNIISYNNNRYSLKSTAYQRDLYFSQFSQDEFLFLTNP